MPLVRVFLFFAILLCMHSSHAQTPDSLVELPSRYISQITSKLSSYENKLDHSTDKVLRKMQQQEEKLFRKLARKDSLKALQTMGNVQEKYASLRKKLEDPASLKKMPYNSYLDTLKTSLSFLKDKQLPGDFTKTLGSVDQLEAQFKKAELVKQFLKERKQLLKEKLGSLGMLKDLQKINKQAYYYAAQVQEYKQVLSDPKKIEEKALQLLRNLPAFKDFMNKHSELASLFRLPGSSGSSIDPSSVASLQGLQTRSMVFQQIQQQLGGSGNNAQAMLQQNLQAAQGQLSALKNKLPLSFGNGSSDMELPDFKPNSQKTKSFKDRLEFGANIQSQRASRFFPTTSDLGLSLGYKLNDKSTIGLGGSYRWGWGKDIQHIRLTHEGVGLRSFVDYKLKGSFWLTGGYEMNYNAGFKNFSQLQHRSAWQESGLVGLMKKQQVGKVKGSVQLLWDFLNKDHLSSPVKFRVGYNF